MATCVTGQIDVGLDETNPPCGSPAGRSRTARRSSSSRAYDRDTGVSTSVTTPAGRPPDNLCSLISSPLHYGFRRASVLRI